MSLRIDRERPFRAIIDLSGSYHLFVNRDPDVVRASSDRKKSHNRRYTSALIVTVDSL